MKRIIDACPFSFALPLERARFNAENLKDTV